jgi:hypothetical protein
MRILSQEVFLVQAVLEQIGKQEEIPGLFPEENIVGDKDQKRQLQQQMIMFIPVFICLFILLPE